jgi:hypothetical protein
MANRSLSKESVQARLDHLEARAGLFADFIGRVAATVPRNSPLAAEARALLRDGLYGKMRAT